MKKNTTISLLVFLPLLVLILIVAIFIFIEEPLNDREYFLRSQKRQNFNSVVIEIKNDKNNRNVETVFSTYNKIVLPRKWKNKAQVGDSISKHSGNLYLKIYRNGEMIDSLNYNDLSGW